MERILDDIVLIDEDGQESRFSHVLTFLYEGERYVALEPIEEEAADEERNTDETEIVLLHIVHKDGEDVYESIDNEVLLDEVFGVFLDAMDEIEERGDA